MQERLSEFAHIVRLMLLLRSESNTSANLQLCKHEHAQRVTFDSPSNDLTPLPSSMTCFAPHRFSLTDGSSPISNMRRSDSPQLQVCELACPSPRETGRTQPTVETMQLFKTPSRNHRYQLIPGRQGSSSPFHTPEDSSITAYVDLTASTTPATPHGIDQTKQTPGLSAGTIVAIVLSGLALISILIGTYAYASRRHKSRHDLRTSQGRRSPFYEDNVDDDDIEMQAQRHTRESLLGQQGQDQSKQQLKQQRQHQQHQHQQQPHHDEGAGMGYDDDEDGKEARIEVGTAKVVRIRRVPAGSVSITNIGRGKAPVPLGSSQSVRDVVSLPDLAWAETLTTGGGRRPGVVPNPMDTAAAATGTGTATGTALPVMPKPSTSSSSKSGSVRSKKVMQERSESRKAVKRKAIREWCARGSGGGLGPYSAAW